MKYEKWNFYDNQIQRGVAKAFLFRNLNQEFVVNKCIWKLCLGKNILTMNILNMIKK